MPAKRTTRTKRQPTPVATPSVTITVDRTTPAMTSAFVGGHNMTDDGFNANWGSNNTVAQDRAKAMMAGLGGMVLTHIHGWGSPDVYGSSLVYPNVPASYGTDTISWTVLDRRMTIITGLGLEPVIVLGMAPGWMTLVNDGANTPVASFTGSWANARVANDRLAHWLHLCDLVVRRYAVAPYNVRKFFVWNELKGHFGVNVTNAWDMTTTPGTAGHADMGFMYLYNQTYAQVRASFAAVGLSASLAQVGGPWAVTNLYPTTSGLVATNEPGLSGLKVYGYWDDRALQAYKQFQTAATDFQLLAGRHSAYVKNSVPIAPINSDWDSQACYTDWITWARGLPAATYPKAASTPMMMAEHYSPLLTDVNDISKKAGILADDWMRFVRGGLFVAPRWGIKGDDDLLQLWTFTNAGNGEYGVNDCYPFPALAALQMVVKHLGVGKAIYDPVVSDATKVRALAGPDHVVVVNKTNAVLGVVVNGVGDSLAAYGIKAVQA